MQNGDYVYRIIHMAFCIFVVLRTRIHLFGLAFSWYVQYYQIITCTTSPYTIYMHASCNGMAWQAMEHRSQKRTGTTTTSWINILIRHRLLVSLARPSSQLFIHVRLSVHWTKLIAIEPAALRIRSSNPNDWRESISKPILWTLESCILGGGGTDAEIKLFVKSWN